MIDLIVNNNQSRLWYGSINEIFANLHSEDWEKEWNLYELYTIDKNLIIWFTRRAETNAEL